MPELPARRPFWLRFLLGALVIVLATATATAAAAFREVDRVVAALDPREASQLSELLAEAESGAPQTVMLIGSDKRAASARDADSGARSDTIILVRLDPDRDAIALLSLPRDLKVDIPGHGTDKLNAAYSLGGSRLTLRTVKQLTGLRINHVVNVDFGGFREVVNEIGCVYADIDRRYFNDNSGPEKYATINVPQGYQRLCGESALDYVRYRHADSDLVRSARQQDFLRQAKAQLRVEELVARRAELVRVFGEHTASSLDGRGEVLALLRLVIASAGRPIQEVHFEGEVGDSYVTASSRRMRKLTREFLGVESTAGPRGGRRAQRPERRRRERGSSRPSGLEDAAAEGREQGLQAYSAGLRFPAFYPTQRIAGSTFADAPRVYGIRAPRAQGGRVHRAYRMVVHKADPVTRSAIAGEYYGIQGTTWRDPPILRDPSETRRIGGRTFELHYDGDRLRLVAWRTPHAVYWISNTLLQSLSERQMLAIARSTRAV